MRARAWEYESPSKRKKKKSWQVDGTAHMMTVNDRQKSPRLATIDETLCRFIVVGAYGAEEGGRRKGLCDVTKRNRRATGNSLKSTESWVELSAPPIVRPRVLHISREAYSVMSSHVDRHTTKKERKKFDWLYDGDALIYCSNVYYSFRRRRRYSTR